MKITYKEKKFKIALEKKNITTYSIKRIDIILCILLIALHWLFISL